MAKRPAQGRGSGGRVTPSPRSGGSSQGSGRSRARVPQSGKPRERRPAATAETPSPPPDAGFPALLRRIFDPGSITRGGDGEAAGRVRPWWGFGDVILWFVVAQVLTLVAQQVTASVGGYALDRPTGPGARAGEVVGHLFAGQAPAVTPTWADIPLWLSQGVLNLPLWAVFIGGSVYATIHKGFGPRRDLKLDVRPLDIPIGLAVGVAAQLVNPLLYRLLYVFIGDQDVSAVARRITDRATSPGLVVLVFVTVGFVAPFAEELFFRGLAMQSLIRRYGRVGGLLLSSAFFAVAHGNPLTFVALFPFAVVLGLLVLRFDRLGPAIAAHVGYNLMTATVLLFDVPGPW